jgi:TPR repeat protein
MCDSDKQENTQTRLSEALNGNVDAQYALACAIEAEGNQIDLALGWYKKAALQGHLDACHKVGLICACGDKEQRQDAAFWFMKAATAGHAPSQYQIGLLYERGIGVAQNPDEGLRWIRLAAKRGDADAKARIDSMNMWLDQITTADMLKPQKKGGVA